jgi:hypothetical protein
VGGPPPRKHLLAVRSRLGALGAQRRGTQRVGPELLEVVDLALAARVRTGGRFDPTVSRRARRRRLRPHVRRGVRRGTRATITGRRRLAAARARSRVDRRTAGSSSIQGFTSISAGSPRATRWIRAADVLGEVGPCLVDAAATSPPADAGGRSGSTPVTARPSRLELGDGAVATSGRDPSPLDEGSEGLHHIIDPATGCRRGGSPPRQRRRGDRDGGRGSSEVPSSSPEQREPNARRTPPPLPLCSSRSWPRDLRGRARMKTDPTFWILARSSGLVATRC